MVTVFYNGTGELDVTIPVWQIGAANGRTMECLMRTDVFGFGPKDEKYLIQKGEITVHMTETSALVLRCV